MGESLRTLIMGGQLSAGVPSLLVSGVVAAVLLRAAVPKLLDLPGTVAAARRYGLVPRPLVPLVAVAILAAELVLTVLLLAVPHLLEVALQGTAGLLVLFGAGIAVNLARGRSFDCGCGVDEQVISWRHVLRNGALAAAALFASARVEHAVAWPFVVVTFASAVVTLYALEATRLWRQLPDHTKATLNTTARELQESQGLEYSRVSQAKPIIRRE